MNSATTTRLERIQASDRMKQAGFTLIEVLVVIAIMGILTAMALPSYDEYVRRAFRAQARTQLLQAANYMQRFYAANDNYLADRGGVSIKDIVPSSVMQSPSDANPPLYKIEFDDGMTSNSTTEFLLAMKPQSGGRMAADKCGAFTLDSLGRRGVLGATARWEDCWR